MGEGGEKYSGTRLRREVCNWGGATSFGRGNVPGAWWDNFLALPNSRVMAPSHSMSRVRCWRGRLRIALALFLLYHYTGEREYLRVHILRHVVNGPVGWVESVMAMRMQKLFPRLLPLDTALVFTGIIDGCIAPFRGMNTLGTGCECRRFQG